MSQSASTISWSEMPGMAVTLFNGVGLLVKKRSSQLSSLVGSHCNYVNSNCWLMHKTRSITALGFEIGEIVPWSQFMSPVLKSPESIKVVLGLFLNLVVIWKRAFSNCSTWWVRWSGWLFFNGLAIPTCITARAWRTCHDTCRDR